MPVPSPYLSKDLESEATLDNKKTLASADWDVPTVTEFFLTCAKPAPAVSIAWVNAEIFLDALLLKRKAIFSSLLFRGLLLSSRRLRVVPRAYKISVLLMLLIDEGHAASYGSSRDDVVLVGPLRMAKSHSQPRKILCFMPLLLSEKY